MTVQLEVDTPARRQTRYACLELLNIAVACITKGEEPESNATLGDNQASSIRTLKLPNVLKHAYAGGNVWPEATSSGALGDDSCSLAKRLTSSSGLWPEKFQGLGSVSSKKTKPEALGTHVPEETGKEREISPSVALHGMEADVPARNLKYACMELLNLAKRELPCTWMHYSQKYRVKLHPLGKELAKFASNRVLRQEHIDDTSGSDVGSQPAEEGSASEERSAMSGAEVYVVSTSIAMKLKRQRCTRAYMRRVLDVYLKNTLRTVNPVKLKNKKQCSPSEEPVKTKDVNKKDISVKPWRSRQKQRR
jgi:hypothetical protein